MDTGRNESTEMRFINIDLVRTGEHLRRLMMERDLTAKAVARGLCVSNQTVYKWMGGRSLPTLENMYQLSRMLEMRIDDILIAEEDQDPM